MSIQCFAYFSIKTKTENQQHNIHARSVLRLPVKSLTHDAFPQCSPFSLALLPVRLYTYAGRSMGERIEHHRFKELHSCLSQFWSSEASGIHWT